MRDVYGADTLLHTKSGDAETEGVIFPVTRYSNVISAPKVVGAVSEALAAPFNLLVTDYTYIDEDKMLELAGAGISG